MEPNVSLGVFVIFAVLNMLEFTSAQHPANNSENAPPEVELPLVEHAKIDVNTLTVSGFSTGAFMSSTMHYLFSFKIKGTGLFAGGPFGIGYNISHRAFNPIYIVNKIAVVFTRSVEDLQAQAILMANQGLIDPVANLNGSSSYIFNGGLDVVYPEFTRLSQKAVDMNKYFGVNVTHLHLPLAAHCVPTDNYGGPCSILDPVNDYVNNCGIESVFKMFMHLYGSNYIETRSSSTPYTGSLYDFDQNAYAPSGNAGMDFMNDKGGIYLPLACQNASATCKLHVAFHGCTQTIYTNIFYDKYAVHAGYLQAADTNNVIVVFPRAAAFGVHLIAGTTNLGCWDWYGMTTTTAVTYKEMPQVKSVMNLLNAIIGTDLFT